MSEREPVSIRYGAAREWGKNRAADLQEYRAALLDWEALEKGLLLVGPPGAGKTEFARAVAKPLHEYPARETSQAQTRRCVQTGYAVSGMGTGNGRNYCRSSGLP